MKKNHARRLRAWIVAARQRQKLIAKTMIQVQKLRRIGSPKLAKAKAKLANLEFYGVLNRGPRHWTKVKGVWGV